MTANMTMAATTVSHQCVRVFEQFQGEIDENKSNGTWYTVLGPIFVSIGPGQAGAACFGDEEKAPSRIFSAVYFCGFGAFFLGIGISELISTTDQVMLNQCWDTIE